MPQTIKRDGKTFVLVERAEYRRLTRTAPTLAPPPLHEPDANGCVPAIAYARAKIARDLIADRERAHLSQAELARLSGVRVETLSRIENGHNTPHPSTLARIDDALTRAARRSRRRAVG